MSSKNITVRKALKEDKEGIIELMKEHIKFHQSKSSDDILKPYSEKVVSNIVDYYLSDSNKRIFVAGQDKTIVGYMICGIKEGPKIFIEEFIGEIIDSFVIANMRGKGITETLIQKCSKWYKRGGINLLEIRANPENLIENKMWLDIGFLPSHITMIKKI